MIDDDSEEISRAKQRAEVEALQERLDIEAVIATPAGRAFVWRLLSACKIYSDGYCGGDHAAMAREAGQRNIGLTLLQNVLTVNSEVYIVMRNEALAWKRTLDERFKPEQN